MIEIRGDYYDGHQSLRHPVVLRFDETRVQILGLETESSFALSEVNFADRLGDLPRSIDFPDGASCETHDNDAVDQVVAQLTSSALGSASSKKLFFGRVLHLVESRWHYLALLLLITAAVVFGFVRYVVPVAAKDLAAALPVSTDRKLGDGLLESLDGTVMQPTKITQAKRNRLHQRFAKMTAQVDPAFKFRLEFRASPSMGANAIALPNGTIIVTDGLMQLSRHEDEVIAVLAHEIGHVVHRHGLRHAIQSSVVSLAVPLLTGDIFSVATLAAWLPTALLEAKYSRDFETEADQYALNFMRSHQLNPRHFANILQRLSAGPEDEKPEPTARVFSYLESHPETQIRIVRFLRE